MSNFENTNSPVPVSPPPASTWDFMETALVCLIAYGVYTLTSGLALTAMLAKQGGPWMWTWSPAQFQAYGAAAIVACPPTIAVLWIAIRMGRRDFAEYLALNWPGSGELLRALGIMTILLLAQALAVYFVGAEEVSPDAYLRAKQADGFLIFLIGSCIAVPIMEEFVVRGFMFRGWSQSFPGPVGAILLTSVVWAMAHTQYDWFGRFWIFVTGLALGHFRWRSASTWLTVMVHSAMNVFILFTAGL